MKWLVWQLLQLLQYCTVSCGRFKSLNSSSFDTVISYCIGRSRKANATNPCIHPSPIKFQQDLVAASSRDTPTFWSFGFFPKKYKTQDTQITERYSYYLSFEFWLQGAQRTKTTRYYTEILYWDDTPTVCRLLERRMTHDPLLPDHDDFFVQLVDFVCVHQLNFVDKQMCFSVINSCARVKNTWAFLFEKV